MTHTPKPISPLRQRMIEDMALRKLAPKTQSNYLRAVINFTLFSGPITRYSIAGRSAPLSVAPGRDRDL